jgi:hypothetical protein
LLTGKVDHTWSRSVKYPLQRTWEYAHFRRLGASQLNDSVEAGAGSLILQRASIYAGLFGCVLNFVFGWGVWVGEWF